MSLELLVGELKGKIESIQSDTAEIKANVKSLDARVDSLRLWRAKVAGVGVAAGAAAALLLEALKTHLK